MDPDRLTTCVMCGAEGVQRRRISVKLLSGVTVRGIEAEVCPACGETYFDPVAMDRLEAAGRASRPVTRGGVRHPRRSVVKR